jgi:hypothetical protein
MSPRNYRERLRANLRDPRTKQMLRFALIGSLVCVCIDPLLLATIYGLRYLAGFGQVDDIFRQCLALRGGAGLLSLIAVAAVLWMMRIGREDTVGA